MRLASYRDDDRSWHLDLVGPGGHPLSVDLVKESAASVLMVGSILSLIALSLMP